MATYGLSFLFLLLFIGWVTCNSQVKNIKFPFDLPKGGGPWIRPTVGQVWPQPQLQQPTGNFMVLRPNTFKFQVEIHLANACFALPLKDVLNVDNGQDVRHTGRSSPSVLQSDLFPDSRKWCRQTISEVSQPSQPNVGNE